MVNNFGWFGHHGCTLRSSDQFYRKCRIALRDHRMVTRNIVNPEGLRPSSGKAQTGAF
jgi:hypothetical protein